MRSAPNGLGINDKGTLFIRRILVIGDFDRMSNHLEDTLGCRKIRNAPNYYKVMILKQLIAKSSLYTPSTQLSPEAQNLVRFAVQIASFKISHNSPSTMYHVKHKKS